MTAENYSLFDDEIKEFILTRRQSMRIFRDLEPRKTALIVVDMQNAFCDPESPLAVKNIQLIASRINSLVSCCRKKEIKVFWLTQTSRDEQEWPIFYNHIVAKKKQAILPVLAPDSKGTEIWPGLDFDSERDIVIPKIRFSPFVTGSSNLERKLRSLEIDTLIVVGTRTNICVESTARDAAMLDYRVIVVSDATITLTEPEQHYSLLTLSQSFCDVASTMELIKDIERGGAKSREKTPKIDKKEDVKDVFS